MTSSRRTRAPNEGVDAEAVVAAPQPEGAAERWEVAAEVVPQDAVVAPPVVVAAAGVAEEGPEEVELSGEFLRFTGNGQAVCILM